MTSKNGTKITCQGCSGYLDSFEVSDQNNRDSSQCVCVHTLSFPTVLQSLTMNAASTHSLTTLQEFARSEFECTDSILLLKKWGDYSRYLVLVPQVLSMVRGLSRYSVCTLQLNRETLNRKLRCEDVKCKRMFNKNVSKKNADSNLCCHLKKLKEYLEQESSSQSTSFSVADDFSSSGESVAHFQCEHNLYVVHANI